MSIEFIKLHSVYFKNEEEIEATYHQMSDNYKQWVSLTTFLSYFKNKYKSSLYWYDYEAGGLDAKAIQPLQHAGIRTDEDLNILDIPNDWYCRLAGDKIPHPMALSVTHIDIANCQEYGLDEPIFFKKIFQEMSVPGTCVVGYNSMKYDETITRFGFWRNLLPVYNREWENGNSRWDLLDVTAAMYHFNTGKVNYPLIDDEINGGKRISLKLENLAAANNIVQENAHNAVDDVKALIDWAKILKKDNPDVYRQLYLQRKKNTIKNRISFGKTYQLYAHRLGFEKKYHTSVLILGASHDNVNEIVYLDLSDQEAVRSLWKLSVEEIKKSLFEKQETLTKLNIKRPPIGLIKLNESPILFELQEVLTLDEQDVINTFAKNVFAQKTFLDKLITVFDKEDLEKTSDPQLALYQEGFPSKKDQAHLIELSKIEIKQALREDDYVWDNPIYGFLQKIAKCKLTDITQTEDEQNFWQMHCQTMLLEINNELEQHDDPKKIIKLNEAYSILDEFSLDEPLKTSYISYVKTIQSEIEQQD